MCNPVLPPQSLAHLRAQDPCIVTLVTMPQRDFSHVAFRACQSACARMYDSLYENVSQGAKVLFSQSPTSARPVPPTGIWGPPGYAFRLQGFTVRLYSHRAASDRKLCAHSVAKDTPRPPKVHTMASKTSLFGARRVTFACRREKICPMRQHILRIRAPPLSHSKSTRERTVHQKLSFSLFYAHFWRQSDAQGRPKAGPRDPKGSTRSSKAIPGTPKNHQKIDLRPHLDTQGRPGGSRGTPGKENDTKIN
jgi:hypothetical protein